MFVIQYRYSLIADALPVFRPLADRMYEIYKANGALYHIVLVDEARRGDVVETLMFADRSVYERFQRVTESHLELFSLTRKFAALLATPADAIDERCFETLFDSAG